MKVDCYLGRVAPEKLHADLVRHGQAEGEAAAIVDQAVEEECRRLREQRLAREIERERVMA